MVVDTEGAVERDAVRASHISRLHTTVRVDNVELDFLALLQESETVRLDLGLVNEDCGTNSSKTQ